MKLTTILGLALVSMLAFASMAQASETSVSGTDFQALTNAKQACLERNVDGWVWFNQSAGTCSGNLTVVSSGIHVNSGTTGSMYCYVDGSCPSGASVSCTMKTISYQTGGQVGTPSTNSSTAGQAFDLSLNQPRSDLGDWNYAAISCVLGPGCRLYGYDCGHPSTP